MVSNDDAYGFIMELLETSETQGLAFVTKWLKEFDIANASRIEAIKWDWIPNGILSVMMKAFLQVTCLNFRGHILLKR